jgi:hypothetical protein
MVSLMKDPTVSIVIEMLKSCRIASSICIGSVLLAFAYIKLSMYMPEFSNTLGVSPLIVSAGVLAICYSAGLITTDAIIWAFPKVENTLYKFIEFVAKTHNHCITKIRQKRTESESVKNILLQLTENERDFLALFVQAEKPNTPQEDKFLPCMIYNAGQTLVHKKILCLTSTDKTYEIFSIQPAVKRTLERLVFNSRKIQCLITLDLRRVQGNQSSGGGAPGSR